jgi:phosphohistidine phosphatase
MRTLVLLRHAKSDWSTEQPDAQRPLAERGRRDAPAAGRWLTSNVERIDLVVCSPAIRARQTWDLAGAELHGPPVRFDERVYAASAPDLLALVRALPDDVGTVVLVGHNPGMEDLASALAGQNVPMKTSSVAVLSWPGTWTDAGSDGGRLTAHATPRG